MPDITPVVVILDGQPVSSINPLPTSGGGGGGGGIVEQGKQGSIASPWFVQPTADGATVSLPLPTGAATDAKQDTGNTSLATIATQQTDGSQKTQVTSSALPTGAATAAKQPALGTAGTPSADVLSVQGVVGGIAQPISAASLPLPAGAATSALQGGGLPAALVGGRLDVNIGASTSTSPLAGSVACYSAGCVQVSKRGEQAVAACGMAT